MTAYVGLPCLVPILSPVHTTIKLEFVEAHLHPVGWPAQAAPASLPLPFSAIPPSPQNNVVFVFGPFLFILANGEPTEHIGGTGGAIPPALPAHGFGERRRQHPRVPRHCLLGPAPESAGGAAQDPQGARGEIDQSITIKLSVAFRPHDGLSQN